MDPWFPELEMPQSLALDTSAWISEGESQGSCHKSRCSRAEWSAEAGAHDTLAAGQNRLSRSGVVGLGMPSDLDLFVELRGIEPLTPCLQSSLRTVRRVRSGVVESV